MKPLRLRHPSPALVIALIALFVSLGGVSYGLASGSISSREIEDNSIRGKDVRRNQVTSREIRGRSIDGTDIRPNRVGGGAVKEEALEASKIRTVRSAEDVSDPERFRAVGAPGQPPFQNGCVNSGAPNEAAAFYMDREGVVHLQGVYTCPATGVVGFQLPAGYRPPAQRVLSFAAACGGCEDGAGDPTSTGQLRIVGTGVIPGGDGGVVMGSSGNTAGLDGVTFRAAD